MLKRTRRTFEEVILGELFSLYDDSPTDSDVDKISVQEIVEGIMNKCRQKGIEFDEDELTNYLRARDAIERPVETGLKVEQVVQLPLSKQIEPAALSMAATATESDRTEFRLTAPRQGSALDLRFQLTIVDASVFLIMNSQDPQVRVKCLVDSEYKSTLKPGEERWICFASDVDLQASVSGVRRFVDDRLTLIVGNDCVY